MITLLSLLAIWIILSVIHVIKHGMDDSSIAEFGTLLGIVLLLAGVILAMILFLP